MKVILEADDLIRILGAHFGAEFDPENVTIKTDPFEVEVRKIPLPESERTAAAPLRAENVSARQVRVVPPAALETYSAEAAELVAARADSDASSDPPPPGVDESGSLDAAGSPLALLEQSKRLEAELERSLPRQRRGGSAHPPSDFQDEV